MATSDFEGQDVIITFEKEGCDTVKNVQAKITSMNMTGGSGDVENVRTFGGNSFQVNKPTGEYELSFDYVVRGTTFDEIQFDNAASQYDGGNTEYRSGTEASKKRWRCIIWFIGTGAGVKTNTSGVVVPKKVGEILRYILKDCWSISNDVSHAADEYAKGTITLRTGSTDESGYANVFKEYTSSQASATTTTKLTVLNATAHGGTLTWNTTTPAWTGSYRT